MQKKVVTIVALLLAALLVLSGCGQKETTETSDPAPEKETTADAESQKPAAEVDTSDVEIEVFVYSPWGTAMPGEGEDPYELYIEETFGGDWFMTLPTEAETELVTRYASGAGPDLIHFNTNPSSVEMFYEQGVLVDDWNVYADKIPNVLEQMGEAQRALFTTEDGKLKALGGMPGDQWWTFMIRQDWLDNLGLKMPSTPEELLEVMRAFTFDDPDGNGQNDTYGFTAAGGGDLGEMKKSVAAVWQSRFLCD